MKKQQKKKWEESSKNPETFQLLLTVWRGIINTYHKPSFSRFIRYSNPAVFTDGDSPAEQNFTIYSTWESQWKTNAELRLVDRVQTIAKKAAFLAPNNVFQPPP